MMGSLLMNVALSSAGFALGGVYLKRFADAGSMINLTMAFAIFAVSNLVYANVLAQGLGAGAALISMAHLIIMSALGMLLFGEKLGIFNIAGLAMALMSIWFFALSLHGT